MSKIMRVYYDNAGLPYKDSALSTLYPIVGSEFTGANNTTEIHFYTENLGQATWVANCKLPDGNKVNRLLVSGVDGDGLTYQSLPLDSELTSIKGHLKIGLNGYAGNISIDEEELENNDLVVISGTPTIIATGIIDIAMNYSPIVIPVSDLTPSEYQQLLGLIGNKVDIANTIYTINNVSSFDPSNYADGQIFYGKDTKLFYQLTNGSLVEIDFGYVDEEALQTTVEELQEQLSLKVNKSSYSNIVYGTDNNGNQITIPIETHTGNIVRRNSNNQISVPLTPTENTDASSKGYVDTFAKSLVVSIDSETYVVSFALKDNNNNTLGQIQTIDLPLESVVVGGRYDSENKALILELDNGNTITIPVSDLLTGLIDENDLQQALQPYIKEIEVTSVLTTNDLLSQVGVNKTFVLDNMGSVNLCYITEDNGTYTLHVISKEIAYNNSFTSNTLVINLLGDGTLDVAYKPIIELTQAMQQLTAGQLEVVNQDNSIIKYNGRLYHKANTTTNSVEFVSVDYDIVSGTNDYSITKYEISVNTTTGATNMISQVLNVYSSGQIDTKLEEYAKVDGYYPTMHVGLADDLYYKGGQGSLQTKPFVFQAMGTDSNTSTVQIGNFASFRSLRGNTIVLNQLVNDNFSDGDTSYWIRNRLTQTNSDNIGTFTTSSNSYSFASFYKQYNAGTLIYGHKYLQIAFFRITSGSCRTFSTIFHNTTIKTISNPILNTWYEIGGVVNNNISNSQAVNALQFQRNYSSTDDIVVGTDTFQVKCPQLIDLTLMFGAGNEPTSILEFNRLFPKPYYEYNAGELLSCKANALKVVGYNQFDGTTSATNNFLISSGSLIADSACDVSDYIKVIAGQTYTLENIQYYNPSLCWYDKNKNFISGINYNGSTSKTFLAPNNAYYCRFTIVKAKANITCFHLTWDGSRTGYEEYEETTYPLPNIELRKNLATGTYDVLYPTGKLVRNVGTRAYQSGDENDSTLTTDKTITYYDLATPTEEDVSTFQQIQPIDDFGTQEFLYDSDIDIPIPQGYEAYYPANYTALVDQLYRHTDGDAEKLVLTTELTSKINSHLTSISGYDNTKTQTLKNVNGVLTWVDD